MRNKYQDYKEASIKNINSISNTVLKYIRESKKLLQFPLETKEEIIDKYVNKINLIKERLFERLENASDTEKQELGLFLLGERENMGPEYFKDRDDGYKELITTICGGNYGGFTENNCKKYNLQNPIVKLYNSFNRYYRSTPNWNSVKKRVLLKKGRMCEICGSEEDIHIHHIEGSYENSEEKLKVLCSKCHIEYHKKYGYSDFT